MPFNLRIMDWFLVYLKTLFQVPRLCSIERKNDLLMISWKLCGIGRGLFYDTIPEFALRAGGKSRMTSVRIVRPLSRDLNQESAAL
jgi:hypothetical protein